MRKSLSDFVSFVKRIPFVTFIINKLKHYFPSAWARVSVRIKEMMFDSQPENLHDEGIEVRAHYANLFQREIDKRKKTKGKSL